MKPLTLGEIIDFLEDLKVSTELSEKELRNLPVYIGNVEELNGIHTAYYYKYLEDKPCCENEISLINADCCNEPFSGNAILIS